MLASRERRGLCGSARKSRAFLFQFCPEKVGECLVCVKKEQVMENPDKPITSSSRLLPSFLPTRDPAASRGYVRRSCSLARQSQPCAPGSTSCPSCNRGRSRCGHTQFRPT